MSDAEVSYQCSWDIVGKEIMCLKCGFTLPKDQQKQFFEHTCKRIHWLGLFRIGIEYENTEIKQYHIQDIPPHILPEKYRVRSLATPKDMQQLYDELLEYIQDKIEDFVLK